MHKISLLWCTTHRAQQPPHHPTTITSLQFAIPNLYRIFLGVLSQARNLLQRHAKCHWRSMQVRLEYGVRCYRASSEHVCYSSGKLALLKIFFFGNAFPRDSGEALKGIGLARWPYELRFKPPGHFYCAQDELTRKGRKSLCLDEAQYPANERLSWRSINHSTPLPLHHMQAAGFTRC